MTPRFALDGEPCVTVTRGDTVESIHRVAVCAVDARGKVAGAAGTIDVPVYLRSTAKPFIASAVVREGVVARFGLEGREIAIMSASHNGEPAHVETVRSILRKIGLDESALRCGAHPPYDPVAAAELVRDGRAFSAIHNNCSGKHAGILALCVVLGADTATYLEPANPAQQHILALCARACGQSIDELPLGVDGCGIPVFATPLRNAALAFSRLATLHGVEDRDAAALSVVREAMMGYPWYVAGTAEFDTALMEAAPERLVAKAGAEAVAGIADLASGTGMVLKVIDGAARACSPAAVAFAREFGLLDARAAAVLQPFAHPPLYNRAGRLVGSISAYASRHATNRST